MLIQGLRAAAALSVLLRHLWHEPFASAGAVWFGPWPWEAGVDVFFVISGFVMVHASAGLFGRAEARRMFLRRRLARVVPLYWSATAAFLLAMLVLPGGINAAWPDAASLLASLAFLPWPQADGLVEPIYSLGWTLNYEVFFYAVFAAFLPLPRRLALAGTGVTLAMTVLAGWWLPPAPVALAFWSNPIILEFIAGMALAVLLGRGVALPGAGRIGLALLGLALLVLLPDGWTRGLRYGPGATLLVAAAVLGPEPTMPAALARWLGLLGDASYALYLLHPFALRAVALGWGELALGGPMGGLAACAAALALALGAALACHRWFEAPITQALGTRTLAQPRP